MQNSEFDIEPTDSTAAIEEIDRKWKRRFLTGIPLLFALPLSMTLLLIFPHVIPDAVFLFIFVLAGIVTFVGIVVTAFSTTRKSYVTALRKLLPLSPPEPRVTEDYAVLAIENVYVFALRKAPYGLYFVAFKHIEPTTELKIDVPKTFWKWDSVVHIEEFRVHNQEGTFTIPTPEGEHLTGEGYLLVLPISPRSYMVHYPDMSRNHLLAVVEYASNLVSSENMDL